MSLQPDHRLQYEDVTTAELAARWAAFLASPGVTGHDDGTFTWVYTAPVDAEGNPIDPGPPMTVEVNAPQHPDPDPRHVPEDDLWDPQAAAWVPRPSVLWALLVGALAGLIVGSLITAAVVHATPRAAQSATGYATGSVRAGQLGVPPAGVAQLGERGNRAEAAGSTPVPGRGAPFLSPAGSLARTSQPVTGVATWYVDHSKPIDGLYGAVPGWHYGDQPYLLRVTAGSRSVVVLIGDCLCGGIAGRVVDLSAAAFSRLAPLAAGVVRVSIERVVAGRATPPPTDVGSVP